MTGMDEFIKTFGNVTVLQVIEIIMAIVFAVIAWKKFKKYVNDKHDAEQQHCADIQEALSGVRAYPEYRKQSIAVQKQLEGQINDVHTQLETKFGEVKNVCDEIMVRLDKIDVERKEREKNRIRDILLQSYSLYANPAKNPTLSWSQMEADSFWDLYKDYENLNGNGHMKNTVKPAMEALTVVPMHDVQRLYELMHSRKP